MTAGWCGRRCPTRKFFRQWNSFVNDVLWQQRDSTTVRTRRIVHVQWWHLTHASDKLCALHRPIFFRAIHAKRPMSHWRSVLRRTVKMPPPFLKKLKRLNEEIIPWRLTRFYYLFHPFTGWEVVYICTVSISISMFMRPSDKLRYFSVFVGSSSESRIWYCVVV